VEITPVQLAGRSHAADDPFIVHEKRSHDKFPL
jgi:hypothetical protein